MDGNAQKPVDGYRVSDERGQVVTDDTTDFEHVSDSDANDTTGATPVPDGGRESEHVDVLVVGSGIAGCAAALGAVRAGARPLVLTKANRPEGTSTNWAQGGISVARGDPDSLKRDILAASNETADPDAVDVLVQKADEAVHDVLVETLDVPFDDGDSDETGAGKADENRFDYAREAAHSESRILHVDASTGTHVLRPFLNYLDDRDDVEIRTDTAALDLLTHEGRVHGVLTDEDPSGKPIFADATILATGGIGDCYGRSTNPPGSTGDGIAMAALAGADVADLEYVQFHPTGFDDDSVTGDDRIANTDPAESADRSADSTTGNQSSRQSTFLLSEAIRGEGAVLRNGDGERFMPDYHDAADLAPRDVVARAVATERDATGTVVLDVSAIDFETDFPDLARRCRDRGVTGAELPVAPCQHFLCGGVDVDDVGRSSLERLYAVGECAHTGVHGANRLASTSLLEGLVWGLRSGRDASAQVDSDDGQSNDHVDTDRHPPEFEAPMLRNSDPELPAQFAAEKFHRLRETMDTHLGLERDPDGLDRARAVLRRLKGEIDAYIRTRTSRDLYELRNACITSLLIARGARENETSTGCHYLVSSDGEEEGEVVDA